MGDITTRETHRCFEGVLGYYSHASISTGTEMRFGVYVPPQAKKGPCPVLYYLAGLTCTEETFLIKAGAQRFAAEHGLILVAPDTSPRGLDLPGEHADWDFGSGAGFYVDATEAPWSAHYRMASYVADELPALIETHFPALPGRRGIMGHSMGGHGALVLSLRHKERWQSVSVLAPISNPVAVPWGEKAFSNYLGPDRTAWAAWDASLLLRAGGARPGSILVDQGLEDQFLAKQLHPEALEAAARDSGQALTLRLHHGYDHSYWFIQTVIADHIAHHARELLG
ncbi:MAG TPA: S-formylglutathione hydrolase [Acetobacteraceae bacterium]|nr:S-formylglutathione hydrolase [Acetobacteraceae bacterium]